MSLAPVVEEVSVPASVRDVWEAWTTARGAESFFAPRADIELRIGGRYEILFSPDMPPGQRGAEGLRVLSFLPEEMLSFEWSAPPQFSEERRGKTWVVVQLRAENLQSTRVRLTNLGWGEGGRWADVRAYFEVAWRLVLARLQHRFSVGPIEWSNPWRPDK